MSKGYIKMAEKSQIWGEYKYKIIFFYLQEFLDYMGLWEQKHIFNWNHENNFLLLIQLFLCTLMM